MLTCLCACADPCATFSTEIPMDALRHLVSAVKAVARGHAYVRIYVAIFPLLLIARAGGDLCACDTKSVSVQFLGEDGKPLKGAQFYFYEMRNGERIKEIYRGYEMSDESTISLSSVPDEFMIGVVSREREYYYFRTDRQQPLVTGHNVIRLNKTGAILVEFSHVDREILNRQKPPVILCYLRRGVHYELASGLGVGEVKKAHLVEGLLPGVYRCQLRAAADSELVYWSRDEVIVRKGETTELRGQAALDVR